MTDATHTCAGHQPGTYACYQLHGCRCEDCRESARLYRKRYAVAKAAGRPTMIPAGPILNHIDRLIASGMTLEQIAHQAGCWGSRIGYLLGHSSKQPRRATTINRKLAERIAAIRPATATSGFVDATGTHRRIRALAVRGWPSRWLDRELGRGKDATIHTLSYERVSIDVRDAYAALYDRLWDVEPPATTTDQRRTITRTLTLSARHGWPPPAAWDDGTGPHGIDNPHATPYDCYRANRKLVAVGDLVDAAETGATLRDLCERFHLRPKSVQRALHRAGRGDLWARVRPLRLDGREQWKDVA